MHRLRILGIALAGVLASCTQPDRGLKVTVTLRNDGTKINATCVKLAVFDGANELKSVVVTRPDDNVAVIGILKGSDLPETITLRASALLGACDDESTLKLNARAGAVDATFPQKGAEPIEILISPPDATLDADQDGFVAATLGGPDCNDTDRSIFPGTKQVCSSSEDTDCDGQIGCDDTQDCGMAVACLSPPDRVVLTPPSNLASRGDCVALNVGLQNMSGSRGAIRKTKVSFSADESDLTFHANQTCVGTIDSTTIEFGIAGTTIYVKPGDTAFGRITITARADQIATDGTATLDVQPREVSKLDFVSAPTSVNSGQCSPTPIEVEFQDSMGRHTDVVAQTSIQLASDPNSSGNSIFFSDAACATPSPSVTLNPGEGTVRAFIKAGLAGPTRLIATSGALSAERTINVIPAQASQLVFTNSPPVAVRNSVCAGGALTLQLRDSTGNQANLPRPLDVQLSTAGSGLSFFGAANCAGAATNAFTIPAGTASIDVWVRAEASASGTIVITAASPTDGSIAPAQIDVVVSPGDPDRYRWVGMVQSPEAGSCSAMPLTLQLVSGGIAATSGAPIVFSLRTVDASTDPTFGFYASPGCAAASKLVGDVVTVPAQQTGVPIYFKGNRARTMPFEIVATPMGTPGIGTTSLNQSTGHTIRPAAPAALAFIGTRAFTTAADMCSMPFTLEVRDQFGNPTAFAAMQTVTVDSTTGATINVGATSCTNGVSTFTFPAGTSSTTFVAGRQMTGVYPLRARVNGVSEASGTTLGATLTVTPGANTVVDMTTSGPTAVTAGDCRDFTLRRHDMLNNDAPATGPVVVTLSPGTAGTLFNGPGCTGSGAIAFANSATVGFSVRFTASGTTDVEASFESSSPNITFTVSPGTPILSIVNPANNANVTAGDCVKVDLRRLDAQGNAVPVGAMNTVTLTLAQDVAAFSDAACSAIQPSPFTVASTASTATFYVKPTRSGTNGTAQATALQFNFAGQNVSLNLNVGPAALNSIVVTTPANGMASVTAGACVPVTVQRRDLYNNNVPVSGPMAVSLSTGLLGSSSTACVGASAGFTSVTGSGTTAQLGLQGNRVVNSPFSATFTWDGKTASVTINVTAGPTSKLTFETLDNPVAGVCTGPFQLHRFDSQDNDVIAGAQTVALGVAGTGFNVYSDGSCSTVATTMQFNDGSAIATTSLWAKSNTAGPVAVSGTIGGNSLGTRSVNVVPAAPDHLFLGGNVAAITAGQCSSALTIEEQDAFNNRIAPTPTVQVSLTSDAGVVFSSGAGCSGTVTQVPLTSVAPAATFSFRPTKTPSAGITATGNGLTLNQSFTVNPATGTKAAWLANPTSPLNRFECRSAGRIEARDANDNPTSVGAPFTISLAVSGTGSIQLFSDAACTTLLPGTTTQTVQIASGTSDVEFFMFATGNDGNAQITPTSAQLPGNAGARSVQVAGTAGQFAVTSANAWLEAGGCMPVTIERRTGASTVVAQGVTAIDVSSNNAAISLHNDMGCTDAPTQPIRKVIAHGASTAVVYARGRSSGTTGTQSVNLLVHDVNNGSGDATLTLSSYPLVRRGDCDLPVNQASVTCTLSPAIPDHSLSRSALFFSSTGRHQSGGDVTPRAQNVECHLDGDGTSTESVVCTRVSSTANATMSIRYQVVSFGRDASNGGISVKHVAPQALSTTVNPQTVGLDAGVPYAQSFVLWSLTTDSVQNDNESFPVVDLQNLTTTSTINVAASTPAPARNFSAQVVTLGQSMASVTSTTTANPMNLDGGTTFTGAIDRTNTFVLASAHVGSNTTDANYLCKRQFNAFVRDSGVYLHRGVDAATLVPNCTTDALDSANVQRVKIPGTRVLYPGDVTITGTSAEGSVSLASVALDKAIVFLPMQGPGGLSGGEANCVENNAAGDDTGPFHARVELTTQTNVRVTRTMGSGGNANCTSVFSPIVVEFAP